MLTWARRLTPPGGLSASTYTTLDTLTLAGPSRITDLADREGISQPGMTALINRLETAGLAVRTPDPTDGRASLIDITDRGREVLAARRAERAHLIAARFGALSEPDQRALDAALPAFRRLTAEMAATPDI
ncbi:MarR family transcriptional regulator [Nakamurella silvestris]|nr:MarR family transcriptional regulator [Nakamurella silvestris]